jgi:hypothetical protein
VTYHAFEPAFSAWGFRVALARPSYESAVLTTRPDGFDLSSTGRGSVTTPAQYQPGQPVRAFISGSGAKTIDLVADSDGRVAVPVDLGPPSLLDEYPRALVLPVPKRTAHVTLTGLP